MACATPYNALMAIFCPLAIVATYNDLDIVPQVVGKLLYDGVDVHILDNWSSDGTFETLNELRGRQVGQGSLSIERFPTDGPTRYYDLRSILLRKEEIALHFALARYRPPGRAAPGR